MRPRLMLLPLIVAALGISPAMAANEKLPAQQAGEIHELLENFVTDYRNDPMAINSVFGIKLGESWWTVTVKRRQEPYSSPNGKFTFHRFGPHHVVLANGAPATPTWYFDFATPEVARSSNSRGSGTRVARGYERFRSSLPSPHH